MKTDGLLKSLIKVSVHTLRIMVLKKTNTPFRANMETKKMKTLIKLQRIIQLNKKKMTRKNQLTSNLMQHLLLVGDPEQIHSPQKMLSSTAN